MSLLAAINDELHLFGISPFPFTDEVTLESKGD
jgi:hypothetical protein